MVGNHVDAEDAASERPVRSIQDSQGDQKSINILSPRGPVWCQDCPDLMDARDSSLRIQSYLRYRHSVEQLNQLIPKKKKGSAPRKGSYQLFSCSPTRSYPL